jgi:hypothetical protein
MTIAEKRKEQSIIKTEFVNDDKNVNKLKPI